MLDGETRSRTCHRLFKVFALFELLVAQCVCTGRQIVGTAAHSILSVDLLLCGGTFSALASHLSGRPSFVPRFLINIQICCSVKFCHVWPRYCEMFGRGGLDLSGTQCSILVHGGLKIAALIFVLKLLDVGLDLQAIDLRAETLGPRE